MITLLMISAVVAGIVAVAAVLLVRLVLLLRQIPDRNEDFDVLYSTDRREVEPDAGDGSEVELDRTAYFSQPGNLREQGSTA